MAFHFLAGYEQISKIYLDIQDPSADAIRAVILCPTRELAAQTTRECRKLAKGTKFNVRLMTSELKTADFSKMKCDILISTPRRLQFSIRRKRLDLSKYVEACSLSSCVFCDV